MPSPHNRLTRALLGLVVLVVAPCLFVALLHHPARAVPYLGSSSPDQMQRVLRRAAASEAAPITSQPYLSTGEHRRGEATSITIASFNIRYSNDANYDSARAPLQRLKRVITGQRRFAVGAEAEDDEVDFESHSALAPLRRQPSRGNPSLRQKYWGERSWFLRGPRIADTVLFHNWDLFAMQEVLDAQYSNLRQWIGDDYETVGVGRDDGKRAGEAVPVWWKRDKFELVGEQHGGVGRNGVQHFWLSTTPEVVGSVGWDADLTRMCTHVALRIRQTGEVVHVFSTHYDHRGVVARSESSRLILRRAQEAAAKTQEWERRHSDGEPPRDPLVVLIGDLNSPRNEGSWTSLVGGHYSVPLAETGTAGPSFLDTALSVPTRYTSPYLTPNESEHDAQLASGALRPAPFTTNATAAHRGQLARPYGPLRTFTDFAPSSRSAVADRIDFVMLLDNGAVRDQTRDDAVLEGTRRIEQPRTHGGRWAIRSFGVVSSWSESDAGFLVSDHAPVVARIESRT